MLVEPEFQHIPDLADDEEEKICIVCGKPLPKEDRTGEKFNTEFTYVVTLMPFAGQSSLPCYIDVHSSCLPEILQKELSRRNEGYKWV